MGNYCIDAAMTEGPLSCSCNIVASSLNPWYLFAPPLLGLSSVRTQYLQIPHPLVEYYLLPHAIMIDVHTEMVFPFGHHISHPSLCHSSSSHSFAVFHNLFISIVYHALIHYIEELIKFDISTFIAVSLLYHFEDC